MAQPYVGEIRIFAGTFAPVGWALCNGQLLPISENETLFQLIGTTYGGDGETTFALPNLQSRIPNHQGTASVSYVLGQMGGQESVTLTTQQIPVHNHPFLASTAVGDQVTPAGNLPANSPNVQPYINDVPDGNMNQTAILPTGGSQPHENMHPFLCVNFIISLFGLFPQQT
ncbi:MAG TPA: tail fiber protein [Frankiaceae bacterium]|nr:tail fiber protein [Frankiaceae bacterium]